jgi:hypothetical protein
MKRSLKPVSNLAVAATAGILTAVFGRAIVGIAQGIPNDSNLLIFSKPRPTNPAEPVALPYRFLQNGFPDDWSHHHLVFSAPSSPEERQLVGREPRYWIQQLRGLWQPSRAGTTVQLQRSEAIKRWQPRSRRLHQDWSMSMGLGAKVGAGIFPAKYNFLVSSASCSNDFVVYNTGLAGTASHPSIVAFNNIYSGGSGCGATVPTVDWAFNTGATISTSAILSADGTQVAMVQVSGAVASLLLLKWAASSGTLTSPVSPTSVTNANYRSCSAPCMTSLTFNGSPNDTNSSPFYDYTNDVLYIGDNKGILHKFTSIFVSGTPQEVTGGGSASGWPQTIDTGRTLTSPVYDSSSGNVFVGSSRSAAAGGKLYRIAAGGGSSNIIASGTLAGHAITGGIQSAPLVDSQASTVYVIVLDDGANSDHCNTANPCFVGIYQLTTSFTSGSAGTEVHVGMNATSTTTVFSGSFDQIYFSSTGNSPTGELYVCGADSGSGSIPTLYQVPITNNSLGSPVVGPALATSSTNCSPVTEFNNGSTDRIFLSVQASGKTTSPVNCPSASGCLISFDVTSAGGFGTSKATSHTASETGGTSGVIIDNSASSSGASQVYFSPLSNQTCAGNGSTGSGTGGCAIQASQSGLS